MDLFGGNIPVGLLVAVGVLIIGQLGLMIAGLIMVARTPEERLTAPRWVWLLVCLISYVGPIVFFAAGRRAAPVELAAGSAASPAPTRERVIDELYGE